MLNTAYQSLYTIVLIVLVVLDFLCLVRAIKGPRIADRIVAINMISTITMAQLGNVYQNLMINVPPISNKMRKRLVYILTQATGCTMERAQELMTECDYKIKVALLMELKGISKAEALVELDKVKGNINHLV